MRIAIVGSRGFGEPNRRDEARDKVHEFVARLPADWVVVSGNGDGPDKWAVAAAKAAGSPYKEWPPRTDLYPYAVACKERDKDIANDVDCLVGFWDGSSTGTLQTFRMVIQRRLPARMVRIDDPLPLWHGLRWET